MQKTGKLELTWVGKYDEVAVEPRILIEDPSKSYGDPNSENMLIHGDNLIALKALQQDYSGKIKCIYIDPPYNTGTAFEHYDDNLAHSIWLTLMRQRLILLWQLLTEDGLLAIQIDDNEFARLYLLLCEVCLEKNLKVICVKMSEATGVKMASVNKAGSIPKLKEYIILAKKDGIKNLSLERVAKEKWDQEYKTYCSGISDEELERVKEILNDEEHTEEDIAYVDSVMSNVKFTNMNDVAISQTGKSATEEWCFNNAGRIVQFATLTGGARDLAIAKKQSYGDKLPGAFAIQTKQGKMYVIRGDFNTETNLSRCKILFADQYLTVNPGDLWTDIKTTGLDNEGCVDFQKSKKPERLIRRIIRLNTQPNDIVLDSFLGSGTTAAVAHKMGRRWIGIEMGDHAYSHCKVRLDKVISGEDQGGISKSVNWQGGGGYKFYELAPSLLVKNPVLPVYQINPEYTFEMLCEAICKIEGFRYKVDGVYHGYSSEKRFIHITKEFINAEYIKTVAATLGEDQSLLIYGTKIQSGLRLPDNIEVKKIPKDLLEKCTFESEVR